MSKLTFYTNPQSRGRMAHWMMEEIGQPYETVWLERSRPAAQRANQINEDFLKARKA